jgi:tetratricopeptide (TPR) repeat protein
VALEPQDAFNRFALGRSRCLLCRYPEAQAELEQAIEANRSFAQAYFALAFCFTVWDRPAAALPLYEKAVHLSPQDPHLWTFHHMRSVALFRLDRLDEAADFVRAAVRQQYATYWTLATLCALLAERGRIEEATAIGDRRSATQDEARLQHQLCAAGFLPHACAGVRGELSEEPLAGRNPDELIVTIRSIVVDRFLESSLDAQPRFDER